MKLARTGRRFSAVGSAALAWLVPAAALACAVCGTGPDVAGDPTARGFYWGILFLMALPFSVFGAVTGWLFYRYWRASGVSWRSLWVGRLAWTHKESGQ
jgi:hypothetical protein